MLLNLDLYEQVPRTPAGQPAVSLTSDPETVAVIHTLGDAHGEGALLPFPALAPAVCAWVFDNLTPPTAVGAGPGHGKEGLLVADLTPAVTHCTADWAVPRLDTVPETPLTLHKPRIDDLLLSSENSLFEGDHHAVAEIVPPESSLLASWSAATEEILKDVRKDIREGTGKVEATREPSVAGYSSVTELIVQVFFFLVGKDGVGFAQLLELILSFLVVRVSVRMELDGQLPVGFFYFLRVRFTPDLKDLVVVSLG